MPVCDACGHSFKGFGAKCPDCRRGVTSLYSTCQKCGAIFEGAGTKCTDCSEAIESTCVVCSSRVRLEDKIVIDGETLHSSCFKCISCNAALKPQDFAKLHGKYFCGEHYALEVGGRPRALTEPIIQLQVSTVTGEAIWVGCVLAHRTGAELRALVRPPEGMRVRGLFLANGRELRDAEAIAVQGLARGTRLTALLEQAPSQGSERMGAVPSTTPEFRWSDGRFVLAE